MITVFITAFVLKLTWGYEFLELSREMLIIAFVIGVASDLNIITRFITKEKK